MKDIKRSDTKNKKRCFVVMGFGTKTDYATGRKLDLNKSYRLLIKPVVESRGLICERADEIRHSGLIDVPMYQQLLKADIIIADISTANGNAFYELGIRHALRPSTTIVISEDKLCYPFDLNHISITPYSHLGDAIDYEEVLRFQKVLGDKLDAVLIKEETDSPVYTFLDNLVPPALREQAVKAAEQIGDVLQKANEQEMEAGNSRQSFPEDKSLALIIEQAEQAIRDNDFCLAKTLFRSAISIDNSCTDAKTSSTNPYLIHRLVLATYKAGQPDEFLAFREAKKLLEPLDVENTNDPETLSLAGALEKGLYEKGLGNTHLEKAIGYFERGFYLRNDGYNGINLAFLLNCRACSTLDTSKDEQIADVVCANRLRKKVLLVCEKYLDEQQTRQMPVANRVNQVNDNFLCNSRTCQSEERFWILVNKAEAHFGLGELQEYEDAKALAEATAHQGWMMKTFLKQVNKLGKLLNKPEKRLNHWYEKALEMV
ncbi:MAG: tetratricopeptide repeat-containing protein [Chitinophagaceae bacterium]